MRKSFAAISKRASLIFSRIWVMSSSTDSKASSTAEFLPTAVSGSLLLELGSSVLRELLSLATSPRVSAAKTQCLARSKRQNKVSRLMEPSFSAKASMALPSGLVVCVRSCTLSRTALRSVVESLAALFFFVFSFWSAKTSAESRA
jgi:hypothetical protein